MKLVRLEKVTATEIKKLAKVVQALAASATYGNRSNGKGDHGKGDARARAIAMTEAVAIVKNSGKALEVSDLCPANGTANEYHIGHRLSRPAESRIGVSVKVHMFTFVTKETPSYIEGYTQTSKGHGRVFIELA